MDMYGNVPEEEQQQQQQQQELIATEMAGSEPTTVRDILVQLFGEKRVDRALRGAAGADREFESAFKQIDALTSQAWKQVQITRDFGPFSN